MAAADWSNPQRRRPPHLALRSPRRHPLVSHLPTDGIRTLKPGRAEGRLLGGCLSILTESLGTPYALNLTEPTILFLEDINTKPYQWDRMLNHLRLAGQLEHVRGIVFGDPGANINPPNSHSSKPPASTPSIPSPAPSPSASNPATCPHHNRSIPLGTWVKMEDDTLSE